MGQLTSMDIWPQRGNNDIWPQGTFDCRSICDIWLQDFGLRTFDHHWQLRSEVLRSNVTHGGQMSEVKCHNTLEWSKVCGPMSRGQMILWSNEMQTFFQTWFFKNQLQTNMGYILKIRVLWTKYNNLNHCVSWLWSFPKTFPSLLVFLFYTLVVSFMNLKGEI